MYNISLILRQHCAFFESKGVQLRVMLMVDAASPQLEVEQVCSPGINNVHI